MQYLPTAQAEFFTVNNTTLLPVPFLSSPSYSRESYYYITTYCHHLCTVKLLLLSLFTVQNLLQRVYIQAQIINQQNELCD